MGDGGIKGNLLCSGHKVTMPYRRQMCKPICCVINVAKKQIFASYVCSVINVCLPTIFAVIKILAGESQKPGNIL